MLGPWVAAHSDGRVGIRSRRLTSHGNRWGHGFRDAAQEGAASGEHFRTGNGRAIEHVRALFESFGTQRPKGAAGGGVRAGLHTELRPRAASGPGTPAGGLPFGKGGTRGEASAAGGQARAESKVPWRQKRQSCGGRPGLAGVGGGAAHGAGLAGQAELLLGLFHPVPVGGFGSGNRC